MSVKTLADTPVMWQPNQSYGELMRKFKKVIENKYNIKTDDYWDFHKWSVEHMSEFWSELWDFSGIIYSKRFDKAIDLSIPLEELPVWFQGAKLNLAENLLKQRGDKITLVIAGESEESEKLTSAQMYEEMKLYAAAFRKIGLKKGDVVMCQMSNRKEATIAMLAVVSIGAIWASVLPFTESEAHQQLEPKIFLTIDRIPHERKYVNMLPKIKETSEGLPSLKKVIIVASNEDSRSDDISDIKNSCFLDEFLQLGRQTDGSVQPFVFEQVPIDHPVFITFTSGTTGQPKAIMHGTAYLLAIFRDFALHLDAGEDSVWFTYTPVGWVTWNIYTSLLFCGATLVLFEESPFFWSKTHFWNLVQQYGATHLFIPTPILDKLQKRNYVPTKENSLESLKVIVAGGTVVPPRIYDFVYEKVKKNVLFSSILGATETIGCSLCPETSLPVYRGENAVSLGLKIETVDDYGKPVFGEMGEIVLGNPVPNFPLGLWNDEDNLMFREKYFSKYPGKFAFNDLGIINPFTKGIIVCCRSEEVLKNGNYRFSSAEIYSIVDQFSEVSDSLCVSQTSETMGERAVLFLKMQEGFNFSNQVASRVREAVKRELTIYHEPSVILETKDVPYNINGKKQEILVKKIINNMPYNADTVINPKFLKFFQNIPELQGY